ncbi:POPLD-domain-containing protein [Suhomyces tanzawaensis NRRL Y-17324]|uniref:POPLD-domain-containing protein n=1 Tax=Suhomyces tanzawaensis NRRL Y-17324 TaxID=984487 RepID=A0A1E4SIU4_9ASCO|nr:POPLD-domain-containing protein [Suhomyces tanzawaensis NRRL Y-17324]ODV79433.1 POPLD-domain-containing protein [Suhomyces tanzawaensis NRRL Y-17324]
MAAPKNANGKNPNAKKARLYNSRTIKTQVNDSSFVDKERLNIPDFLQSRTFEIKSFELSQLKTKNASATRVFQSLPRVLRRRAASHNVKRIPKRLRNRSLKEMKNSLNGVPPKTEHLRGRQLYRLNTRKKLLKLGGRLKLLRSLPTDDFYNQKFNMREKIKKLNEEITSIQEQGGNGKNTENVKKLNNACGSYDNTGINEIAPKPRGNIKFHKRQHKFTWLPTHIWHSKRFHMTKQYGYQIPLTPTQKCFRLMNRQKRSGTILVETSYLNSLVLEIKDQEKLKEVLLSLTKYVKKVPQSIVNGNKSYHDWIEIKGKKIGKGLVYASLETCKILIRVQPCIYKSLFTELQEIIGRDGTIYDCSYSLGSVDLIGPTAINSISKVLHLFKDTNKELVQSWSELSRTNDSNVVPIGTTLSFDIMDPRIWKRPVNLPTPASEGNSSDFTNDLIIRLSQWNSSLITKSSIFNLLEPSGRHDTYKDQFSTKAISQKFSQTKDSSNSIDQAYHENSRIPLLITKVSKYNWTVIMPWYWVLPLWIKLIGVRNIKTGGLKQIQQANFEEGVPNFPQDYPFLKDGWIFNELLGKITKEKHDAKPLNLQNKAAPDLREDEMVISPFNCDWNGLKNIVYLTKYSKKSEEELKTTAPNFATFDENLNRIVKSYDDIVQIAKTFKASLEGVSVVELFDKNNQSHATFNTLEVSTLKEVVQGRIPVAQVSIELVSGGKIKDGARIYTKDHKEEVYQPWSFIHLVGYVSSGAFNLSKGKDSGVGAIIPSGISDNDEVLVRNIGTSKMYTAKLRFVKD